MKRIKTSSIYLIISVILMIIIFMFSAQNSEQSSASSNGFISIIISLFDSSFNELDIVKQQEIIQLYSFSVRKLAHFSIYLLLGFNLNGFSYYFDKFKRSVKRVFPILLGLIYAITDEVHQHFVPGRAMQIADVLIDFSGILAGTLLFFIINKFYYKKRENFES